MSPGDTSSTPTLTPHGSKPDTQKEAIARLYNAKVEELARAADEREGRPYGTTAVDLDKLAAIWDEPDPKVNEEDVWHQVTAKAARALADDPTLDEQDVIDEIPIEVARLVYPRRESVIKSMGGLSYDDWARDAETVEAHAAKLRQERGATRPTTELPAAPAPAQGMARPSEQVGGELSAQSEPSLQPASPPPVPMPPALPAAPVAAPMAVPMAPAAPAPVMAPGMAPGAGMPRPPIGGV